MMVGLLVFLSFQISFLWIVTVLIAMTFILLNYKAMEQLLAKVELKDNSIEFTYYNSKMEKEIAECPINDLRVEYYGNGKGISSLVSNHMRIECQGQTIIKQYKTHNWTHQLLRETTEKLNGIKKNKN